MSTSFPQLQLSLTYLQHYHARAPSYNVTYMTTLTRY